MDILVEQEDWNAKVETNVEADMGDIFGPNSIIRLAGDYLYVKCLFIWPSLVMSFMMSYHAIFLQWDVLDEILAWIESVPETFPFYS